MRVAFLHGFLGQPSMWAEVARQAGLPLALAPGLPGHGREPWLLPDGTTFDQAALALAGRIGEGPVVLCGYSMGARLALAIACLEPARVAGLLLVGVDPGLESDEARRARATWDDEQARAIEQGGLSAFVEAWESLPLFASHRLLPDGIRAAQRAARLAHQPGALAQAMRLLGLGRMPSRWPALASLSAPSVVLSGESDEKFTAIGHKMAEASRRVRHVIAPGAGHNVVLERPSVVARELARLVDEAKASERGSP